MSVLRQSPAARVPVVVFGGKDVMVAMFLIADVSTLLLMIKYC